MAGNYAQLLDIINNPTDHSLPAWDNDNKLIEGLTIKQYLLTIINSLTVGYQFMGVATPSTSPGTPDQNVFYIGGAGTYANFGTSITVRQGQICVFKWNGSWTNTTIEIANSGFVNVNDINGRSIAYDNTSAGRSAVPTAYRKGGLNITYLLSTGWVIEQFIGDNVSDWGVADNWKTIGPISVLDNTQPLTIIKIGFIENTIDTPIKSVSYEKRPLIVRDENGYVILEFNNGELRTKYFDSNKTPQQSESLYDFSIADYQGYIILAVNNGELRTKKFDSSKTPKQEDNLINGCQIMDENGNIVLQSKDGNLRTKYFNSQFNIKNQFRFLHWNVGHWCGGQNTQTSITTTEEKNRAEKAYRTFFNKYNADIIGISEYSDAFSIISGVSSLAKDDLFSPYPRYLIGKGNISAWVKNALFGKNGCVFGGINYIDFENNFYALWTKAILVGREVVLCELHAPWQSAQANIDAINAVITAFANYPYVIISGDYNTRTDSADTVFAALKAGGYELANHGYMGEILTHGYADESHNIAGGIDNIAVKGGKILNIISPNGVDIEERQMVNTGSPNGAYVDITKYNIKIGYNIEGEDGNTYSLSDHLPIMCDIIF